MKKFKIPPCQNHSLSPRVGKWGSANASPLLRAFQPVTCRFSMLLWLGKESPRPPLPKADPKHSHMRSLKRGWTARSPRRNVSRAFCQPSELPQKIISLGKRNEFQHDPLFSRVSLDCRSKRWGYSNFRSIDTQKPVW